MSLSTARTGIAWCARPSTSEEGLLQEVPMSDEEPPWWKWAGIPRLRRSAGDISRREWRDIAWGVFVSAGILVLALLLLYAVMWLVR
jgi:hypothetical protein